MRIVRFTLLCFILASVCSCKVNPKACFQTDKQSYETGETVYFLNCSTDADKFEWDFGDSIISSDKNPSHVYLKAGSYLVKLTSRAYNDNKSDYIKNTVIVNQANTKFTGSYQATFDDQSYFLNVTEGKDPNSIVLMMSNRIFCNADVTGYEIVVETQNFWNSEYQYIKDGTGSLILDNDQFVMTIDIVVVDSIGTENLLELKANKLPVQD
ncbi:MAG: PKD domain-containing protein [Bacteroidia bacterium]|nr:PKD domain-containing protein [Bacteroidia bacterium]